MLKYTTFFHLTEQFAHCLKFWLWQPKLATAVAVLQPLNLPASQHSFVPWQCSNFPASQPLSTPLYFWVLVGHFSHCHRESSGTSKTSFTTIHMYITSIVSYSAKLQFLYSGLMWSEVLSEPCPVGGRTCGQDRAYTVQCHGLPMTTSRRREWT